MKKLYLLLLIAFGSFSLNGQCVADFYSVTTTGSLVVSFYDSSSVNPNYNVSYYWDFGNFNTSTQQNPSHTYTQPGTYIVYLTISDNANNCYDSTSHYVTVTSNQPPPPCNASFTYQVNAGVGTNPRSSVNFYNNSTGYQNTSAFYFTSGDGGSSTFPATNGNLNVTWYYMPGTYIATLTLIDSVLNYNCSFTDTIVVPSRCDASFLVQKDTSTSFGVTLLNTSSNEISHQYSWDFGDGNTGTGRTPSHQYAAFGSYNVCITITDSLFNCVSTFCDSVGMDSLGNLKSNGFGLRVIDPISVSLDENQSKTSLNIYPNPVKDQLNIELDNFEGIFEIRIRNINGQLMQAFPASGYQGNFQLDLSSLSSGIYVLEMEVNGERVVKKFIKE